MSTSHHGASKAISNVETRETPVQAKGTPEVVRIHGLDGADDTPIPDSQPVDYYASHDKEQPSHGVPRFVDSAPQTDANGNPTTVDYYAANANHKPEDTQQMSSSDSPDTHPSTPAQRQTLMQHWRTSRRGWLTYMRTKDFWIVLLLGQVLSLALTGQNTLSGLLANAGVSIPALQIMPNYFLLASTYGGYTIYKYGFKGYLQLLKKRGWRYLILSFCDVEGNYFTILAYRYTTILQAQLINIWAIVFVVLISFTFLKVRYYWTQYLGIVIAIGGLGIMIGSDHITGANSPGGNSHVKGDLFALLGATFYGFSNVWEEFLVSKAPLYEVLGQLGTYGFIIAGVQTAIFDRAQWKAAEWTSDTGGYFTGFTILLTLFYSLAPILFRLASAAFFNVSLLTANFWGVCIGVQVFGYTIYYLYPIAFVVVILGMLVYFLTESIMGEAKKPWLGENQERGVSGVGTAKWRAERSGLRSRNAASAGDAVEEVGERV